MPRIDPLLSALLSNRAESVRLSDGEIAHLVKAGAQHPLTRQPLGDGQLLTLLREMAPADVASALGGVDPVEFIYANSDGRFVALVMRENGMLKATVSPEPAHGNGSHKELKPVVVSPPQNQPLPGPAPVTGTTSGRPSVDSAAHAEIDALLKKLVDDEGSDLHLRVGEPPMLRLRVIPAKVATVEDLGITQEVQNLCYLTKGLVLLTGPTGSGKSTTLGGLIDLVNRSRNDHVITIEDPIEFVHVNKKCVITQRQVGLHTGSFKQALRAALREDPDVVLIGELRDLETIAIAIETAETGHLVFGTLHTTTAVGTIDRIIDQFPPDRQAQIRVMLADSLKGVISQTLCKKISDGRIAAREILLTIPSVSNLIREGKAFQIPSVMQTSRKLGMILLGDVLIDLVDQGLVAPQEAYMKSTDKNAFMAMLKNRGLELNLGS